jgi:molybdopterin-containing oxidoreductase family iron-sulfur binding subunit
MDESRRSFLKDAGIKALGLGWGLPLLNTACSTADSHDHHIKPRSEDQWAMVVDVEKCQNEEVRSACIEACHVTHNVPNIPEADDAIEWIWAEEYKHVFPDQVHDHTPASVGDMPVLVLCNHCTNPPCVRVCPTGATWKRETDGLVMMDMHRCIGCRYCMAACPYGSRSFNWRDPRPFVETDDAGNLPSDYPSRTKGVVEKCNFCAERIRVGELPACVEAANAVEGGEGALTFGDVTDPDSDVSRVLHDNHTISRRVGLGTGPNVYYII